MLKVLNDGLVGAEISVDVSNVKCKELFDSTYLTGYSSLFKHGYKTCRIAWVVVGKS